MEIRVDSIKLWIVDKQGKREAKLLVPHKIPVRNARQTKLQSDHLLELTQQHYDEEKAYFVDILLSAHPRFLHKYSKLPIIFSKCRQMRKKSNT